MGQLLLSYARLLAFVLTTYHEWPLIHYVRDFESCRGPHYPSWLLRRRVVQLPCRHSYQFPPTL